MMWLLGVAWGQDSPSAESAVGRYKPVDPPGPPEWLVTSGTIWLRDADLCFPVRAEDASNWWFVARVCEDPGVELVCNSRFGLASGFAWRDDDCRLGLAGPEGTRTTEGGPPPGVLVSADDTSVTWSPEVALQAAIGRPMVEVRPCTEDSLAALEKQARKEVGRDDTAQQAWLAQHQVVDGQHRCDVSEGAVAVPTSAKRTVSPGTRTGTTAADCRAACQAPAASSAVFDLQKELAAHRWYDPTAPTLRLYKSKADCLASPAAASHIDRDLCNTLGGQLRAQASGATPTP